MKFFSRRIVERAKILPALTLFAGLAHPSEAALTAQGAGKAYSSFSSSVISTFYSNRPLATRMVSRMGSSIEITDRMQFSELKALLAVDGPVHSAFLAARDSATREVLALGQRWQELAPFLRSDPHQAEAATRLTELSKEINAAINNGSTFFTPEELGPLFKFYDAVSALSSEAHDFSGALDHAHALAGTISAAYPAPLEIAPVNILGLERITLPEGHAQVPDPLTEFSLAPAGPGPIRTDEGLVQEDDDATVPFTSQPITLLPAETRVKKGPVDLSLHGEGSPPQAGVLPQSQAAAAVESGEDAETLEREYRLFVDHFIKTAGKIRIKAADLLAEIDLEFKRLVSPHSAQKKMHPLPELRRILEAEDSPVRPAFFRKWNEASRSLKRLRGRWAKTLASLESLEEQEGNPELIARAILMLINSAIKESGDYLSNRIGLAGLYSEAMSTVSRLTGEFDTEQLFLLFKTLPEDGALDESDDGVSFLEESLRVEDLRDILPLPERNGNPDDPW